MCGRFTLRVTPKALGDLSGVPELPLFNLRFNIALHDASTVSLCANASLATAAGGKCMLGDASAE